MGAGLGSRDGSSCGGGSGISGVRRGLSDMMTFTASFGVIRARRRKLPK